MTNPLYPPVDDAAIDKAVRLLSEGALVAIPTETVYGLAADADNKDAVLATFAVKNRPTNHPLIVHVAGPEALDAWAVNIPSEARLLVKTFWPGPLTLVLKKSERCGDFVTGGQDSVALRCPSHPWTRELLKRFAGPNFKGLTAPSCNTFGQISPTCARHVLEDLGVKPTGKLDMILDGGVCEVGVESTMINLSGRRPEILRHGAVTREMLEAILGCPVPDAGSDAPRASGRLKSHYAPKTKLEIVPKTELKNRVHELSGMRLAVMASPQVLATLAGKPFFSLISPATLTEYAHGLYENLHELDAAGADRILVEEPPKEAPWAAVNDRLGRAAAEKPRS